MSTIAFPDFSSADAPGRATGFNVPGTLTASGQVAAGQTIRVTVQDTDGVDAARYAWEVMDGAGAWSAVPGADGSALTLGTQAPAAVRVAASYADILGRLDTLVATLGTEGNDRLEGSDGSSDTILAGAGDDVITNRTTGYATDVIDGGAGFDILYTNQYYIERADTAERAWRLLHNGSNTTHVTGVERIMYDAPARGLLGFATDTDVDGAAGQAYRLYHAAFDRAPDSIGAGFWIGRLDAGMRLVEVADAFIASQEFRDLYGAAPGNAELVDRFYQHVLGRAPDAVGAAFWTGALDSGRAGVADVLAAFSQSPENVAALVGVLDRGFGFTPYVD